MTLLFFFRNGHKRYKWGECAKFPASLLRVNILSSWYGMAPSLCVWGYSCAMTSAGVANAKDLICCFTKHWVRLQQLINLDCCILKATQHDGLFQAPKQHPLAYRYLT
jgi:hypothetical protein